MLDLSPTGLQILEKTAAYAVHIARSILSECRSVGSLPDYEQRDFKEKRENWGLDTPTWPMDGRIQASGGVYGKCQFNSILLERCMNQCGLYNYSMCRSPGSNALCLLQIIYQILQHLRQLLSHLQCRWVLKLYPVFPIGFHQRLLLSDLAMSGN